MRKRDIFKRGVRQLLRRSEPASPPTPSEPSSGPSAEAIVRNKAVRARPDPGPRPTPPTPEPTPSPRADATSKAPESNGGPIDANPDEEEATKAAEMAVKAAKHFERTRRAMLKFVVDQGGTASLADMHDRSERRYFIGHKRFSTLMEGLVDEGLIDFDHATGTAAITAGGRGYIEAE